jgi:hypothetical protein
MMVAHSGHAPAGLHSRQADHLVVALRGIFGDRLRSLVAYGLDTGESLASLALVGSVTMADLEACAARAHGWQRDGIATPLLLPEEEFRRSLDAFPLEYAEIIRAHQVLFGTSPFDGTTIERGDLRRACETQIKSHLVHLREGFIEAGGIPRAIADLVTASAPSFGALLRNIARLNGSLAGDRAAATRDGARDAQLSDAVVIDILALERPSALKAIDAARLFPEYLAAVEQLARYVDTWNV